MILGVVVGLVGGLGAAWFGSVLASRRDVRRRMFAVIGRVEVIVRRDLPPPLMLDPNRNERTQMVLDWTDTRVRGCEEELRSLAIERRGYRDDLRSLAVALDSTWQAYHHIVYVWTLPQGHPGRAVEVDALGYLEKHNDLGKQVNDLRRRLEPREFKRLDRAE